MKEVITNLEKIKQLAAERESENDAFRTFLKAKDSKKIDSVVHALNDAISPEIDCTQCGNCCKSLLISVTKKETERLAGLLQTSITETKAKYIEEGESGNMLLNKIPCHFLEGTKCSIYENRFADCREFPHLHQNNFTSRLFSMMMHYGTCPIIFNVLEELKTATGFKKN